MRVAIRPLNRLTVTEWTVTEWTESRNWTESMETYEANRSASRNWTESTETYEAKRSAQATLTRRRSRQGQRLAAMVIVVAFAAASPHL